MKTNPEYSEYILAMAAYKQAQGVPFDMDAEQEKRDAKERKLQRAFRDALVIPLTTLAVVIVLGGAVLFAIAHR